MLAATYGYIFNIILSQVVNDDIPKGILGPHLVGILHDVKVQSKGPDDACYNKYSDLR